MLLSSILKRVQVNICHVELLQGSPPTIRLPITAPVLTQMRGILDTSSNPDKVALWAATCTPFFGFFHLGELLLDSKCTFDAAIHLAWGHCSSGQSTQPSDAVHTLEENKV